MGKLRRWLWRRLMLLQLSASSPRKRQLHIYGDPSWPGKGCPDNHHFRFYYSRGQKCLPSILINQRPHFLIADPQDAADEYTDSCINDMNDDDESEHAIRDGQPGIHTAAHRRSCSRVGLKLCLKPNKAMITEDNYPVYPDRHDRIDKAHLCRSFSQGDGHHDHWLERQLYNKLSAVHHGHDRQLQLRRSHSCSKPSPISGTTNHCGSSHGGKQHRDHSTVVMKGYVAVYVGEDEDSLQRFLVPVSYLSHPAFQELLQRAEREFGFAQKAGLTIPCGLPEFYQTVREIHHHDHHHEDEGHSTQPRCIPFDNVVMGRSLSYSRL